MAGFDFGSLLAQETSGHWLTRFVFLRFLGIVYFAAFLSLVRQVVPLLGREGLTPAGRYLDDIRPYFRNRLAAFWNHPTVFWLWTSDNALKLLAWAGLLLSIAVMAGFANVPMLLVLWLIYLSFANIGQVWYGYGWESELLETGLTAVFLVPLVNPEPFPDFAPPVAAIWLLIWLAFRVHLGAGLIKLRADSCWRDLSCLYYHFETQPLPNPLSRYFHFLPRKALRIGVLWTHFAQLIAPFLLLIPGTPRLLGGMVLFLFQFILILSGNLSFLNIISMAAIIAAFDDAFLANVLPSFIVEKAAGASLSAAPANHYAAWAFFAVAAALSIPVVKNMLSKHQIMNASFNQFHLINTYGAFGSVGRKRHELVIKGTENETVNAGTEWKEYEFVAKPGKPERRLPVIAPYQPRIDWQIWFAAMQSPEHNPWLLHFIWKLLHNDRHALSLLAGNPFPDKPPRHIKVDIYEYKFAPPGSKEVWHRRLIGAWLPPLSVQSLSRLSEENAWKPAVPKDL